MLRIFVIIGLLIYVLSGYVWSNDDYHPLSITSPKNDESFFDSKVVHISWNSDLGDGFTYSISYSSDGKVFNIPVAAALSSCKYDWQVDALPGTYGYIKVKMMDYNGVPIDEQVVSVNWTPQDAIIVSKANQRVYRFENWKLK